ncbi:cytochrome P450 3A8 [Parasteatoda tepidariorum]|uniref:cytochrome P450 3A8 n=1 Tax=Parasteatoda tepidariorum TaxID=114398 RepID=UPI001C719285|nr:cytochrome P450 3A8 [Parasteatoda tepidariorum]
MSEHLFVTFVIGIFTLLLALWYSMRKQSYWKQRKIPYVKPIPFIGSLYENMITPIMELELKRHFALGSVYGHYEANRPLISIADPQLLRDIFVKDFVHFVNRRPFKSGDKISDKMISILEGDEWKKVRSIISPTFSTGKLKRVMSIFKDCSKTLIQNFRIAALKNEPVNAKRFFGAFTMDVIASSAFSTKIDSHNDPENEFVQAARRAFTPKFNWRLILFLISPKILKLLNISLADPSVNGFFSNVTTQIIEQRKRTKQKRNDFLQLLIDAAEEENDDMGPNYQNVFTNDDSHKSLTMNEVIAQCIIFFLAGYDTTASALSFSSYLLAIHQEVQEKARQEIIYFLDNDGVLTYESLNKMKYLDNIISETLRIYPPAVRTERKVESEYELGDTGIILEKDMIVTVPIYALHHDPKYFPDPEKFDPDRFSPEERKKRDSYSYLPFGHGPRNCIGMRFALMEIKVCLVYIISSFNINTCHHTKIPIQFRPNAFGLLQPQEIFLSFELRDDSPLQI